MGYCDYDDAWLRALTRQRRAEAKARRLAALPPTVRYAYDPADYRCKDGKRTRAIRDRAGMLVWMNSQWREGNRRCTYCTVPLRRGLQGGQARATVDHKDPLMPGVNDHPWNYAMACARCNHRKDRMPETEFRRLLACEAVALAAE